MTTSVATQLTDALQALVDARLDTIDRMLLGRVNRQDRLAIVREVESQIFDLLQRRDAGSLDRDGVLAVLARLDPPEAYLPDEESTFDPGLPHAGRPATPRTLHPSTQPRGRLDLVSGILGLVSVAMIFVATPLAFILPSIGELLLLVEIPLVFVTSLLAVVLAAWVRLRGGWSIAGLVSGLLSLLLSCLSGILLLLGGLL